MTEPGKSISKNRNIPQKPFLSGTDDISYNEKYEQCSDKMKNPGSCFTVFGKIKLIKFSVGFNSFSHGRLVY